MSSSLPSIALAGVPQSTMQLCSGQAQQALADLMAGRRYVTVTYAQGEGSRSVTYMRTDMGSLRAWIAELQRALNPGDHRFRRRAIGLRF